MLSTKGASCQTIIILTSKDTVRSLFQPSALKVRQHQGLLIVFMAEMMRCCPSVLIPSCSLSVCSLRRTADTTTAAKPNITMGIFTFLLYFCWPHCHCPQSVPESIAVQSHGLTLLPWDATTEWEPVFHFSVGIKCM